MPNIRHRSLTEQEIARVVASPGVLEAFLDLVDRLGPDEVSLRSVERAYWRAHRGRVGRGAPRTPDWRDPRLREVLQGPLSDREASHLITSRFRVLARPSRVKAARARLAATGDPGVPRTVPLTAPVLEVLRDETLTNRQRAENIGALTGRTPTPGRISQLRRMLGR